MKALSLWQPWAHLIVFGTPDGRRKRWETRRWNALPASLVGQRLAIHAAKRRDAAIKAAALAFGLEPSRLVYGALLGHGLVDCVKRLSWRDEPEALCECEDCVGIGLCDLVPFDPPIAWRGERGIFHVHDLPELAILEERLRGELPKGPADRLLPFEPPRN